MESILDWGIGVIRAFQTVTCTPLTLIAGFIHYVFNAPVYVALIMLVYWCFDTGKGMRVGTALLLDNLINDSIKGVLKVPRPYKRDPSVFSGYTDSFYSTPSGHSSSAASFFPVFAGSFRFRKIWRIMLAAVLPVIVALSRVYLGVHYPTDVLAGLMLGYIVSAGMLLFGSRVAAFLNGLRASVVILIAAVVCFAANAVSMENTMVSGLFFGAVCGYQLLRRQGGMNSCKGSILQKILRLVLGAALCAVVYLVGKLVFPGEGSEMYDLFRFVRYLLVGFTMMFLCPFVFIKLKMAETETQVPETTAE